MLYSLCLIWLFRLFSLIMLVQKAYGIGCALILNLELCRSLLTERAVQSGFQISGNTKGSIVRCAVIIITIFPDAVKIQIQVICIQSIHVLQSYAVFRIALKRAVIFRCPIQKRYFNQPAFVRIPCLVGLQPAIQIILLQPERRALIIPCPLRISSGSIYRQASQKHDKGNNCRQNTFHFFLHVLPPSCYFIFSCFCPATLL